MPPTSDSITENGVFMRVVVVPRVLGVLLGVLASRAHQELVQQHLFLQGLLHRVEDTLSVAEGHPHLPKFFVLLGDAATAVVHAEDLAQFGVPVLTFDGVGDAAQDEACMGRKEHHRCV